LSALADTVTTDLAWRTELRIAWRTPLKEEDTEVGSFWATARAMGDALALARRATEGAARFRVAREVVAAIAKRRCVRYDMLTEVVKYKPW
jgi:hypothetical protein